MVGDLPTSSAGKAAARAARQRDSWSSGRAAPEASKVPKGSYLSTDTRPEALDPLAEARRSVDDLGSFFTSLSTSDRWTAGAALALLGTLALPWRWTKRDDELIGLFAAWPMAFLALAVTGLVYWRTRRATVRLGRTLLLCQLVATLIAALSCGWFLRVVADVRSVKAAGRIVTTPLSTAEPGAYLGLLCAAVAAIATVATIGEKR
jgi:hypothetical protein